jgi:CHAT domain-containing protein
LADTRLTLQGGDLDVKDVYSLNLGDSPLVVLSACETGLGDTLGRDEVVSMSNAFLLHSQAVVSSLWKVRDNSTSTLISRFYKERSHGNAAALALAQRAMIHADAAPYLWAGFTLSGW